MTEVLFYQLDRQPLDLVLPRLLEMCIERNWTAIVVAGSVKHRDALDARLWTYRDDSFLPHGTDAEIALEDCPVLIRDGLGDDPADVPAADVCFLVDGVTGAHLDRFSRVVYMFDGRNDDVRDQARTHWREMKSDAQAHKMTYWRQDSRGVWQEQRPGGAQQES